MSTSFDAARLRGLPDNQLERHGFAAAFGRCSAIQALQQHLCCATAKLLLKLGNGGESFEHVGPAEAVTSASFSPDGQQLLFGSSKLSSYDLTSKQVRPMQVPSLATEDVIGYIAVNPVRPVEVAIATLGRDIFHSTDGGRTWQQIAQSGQGT